MTIQCVEDARVDHLSLELKTLTQERDDLVDELREATASERAAYWEGEYNIVKKDLLEIVRALLYDGAVSTSYLLKLKEEYE